jgi:DNA-binding NtrC family response regulator
MHDLAPSQAGSGEKVKPHAPARPPGAEDGEGVWAPGRVLVVQTDERRSAAWIELLGTAGYEVTTAESGRSALHLLDEHAFHVVLLDLDTRGTSGLNVLSALPAIHTDARFIVTTRSAAMETAVEAMRLGAFDFVLEDIHDEDLLALVNRAHEEAALARAAAATLAEGADGLGPAGLIGRTPVMRRLLDTIARVARTRANVLVAGETGTGKELVALAIHELSDRADGPFVPVNCSALPETLLEAELFGYEKGAFTGAIQSRKGLIEQAAGGTLFLDEVGTLSQDVQVKLLRVLQDRRIQRIGARSHSRVDFRLVAATNTDLQDLVRRGSFREDLYYRLHVFPVRVPPLRERAADIGLLARHFISVIAEENGLEPPRLPPQTLSRMLSYPWPGNVRELENFIERSVILFAGRSIPAGDLEDPAAPAPPEGELLERAEDEEWTLEWLEREHILAVLDRLHGHQGEAARALGVNRRTIHRRLKRYREDDGIPVT